MAGRDGKLEQVTALPAAPDRPRDAHKGTFGTVIVVGGCDTMMGAPALAASAALRGGGGLCKIATVREALPTTLGIEPGATGILIGDDLETNLALLDQADRDRRAVLAVGPGLGGSDSSAELVDALLAGERAVVLDADGLNRLAATGKRLDRDDAAPPLILTPHPGEFARLAAATGIEASATDPDGRPIAASELATCHRAVVVLKGQATVVSDGVRYYINTTGNPVMATAGSGDVLTGLIAALVAQGVNAFDAAVLGVYLHGLAGDRWAVAHGSSGMKASELADGLPAAFEQHREDSATT